MKSKSPVSEEMVIEALRQSGGIQTAAADMLHLTRGAISKRISRSLTLQEEMKNIKEELLDICETQLVQKIRDGNMTALIFYLKCQGKLRGYIERQELDVKPTEGGVLIVPGMVESSEKWEQIEQARLKKQEKKNEIKMH